MRCTQLRRRFRERTGIELVLDNRVADLYLSVDQELRSSISSRRRWPTSRSTPARAVPGCTSSRAHGTRIVIEDDGVGPAARRERRAGRPHFGMESCASARSAWAALEHHTRPGGPGTRVHAARIRFAARPGPTDIERARDGDMTAHSRRPDRRPRAVPQRAFRAARARGGMKVPAAPATPTRWCGCCATTGPTSLVMDLRMPEIDGLTCRAAARRRASTRRSSS